MILVNEKEKFLDKFIDRQLDDPGRPFFSYVALESAYISHRSQDTYIDSNPIVHQYPTTHMDMLLEMDKAVCLIVQALEDRNLVYNTLIIFFSDNEGLGGPYDSEKFDHYSNAGLRGSQGSIYEDGTEFQFQHIFSFSPYIGTVH